MHVMVTDEPPIEFHPAPHRQNTLIWTESNKKAPSIKVPKSGLAIRVAAGITGFGKTELIIVGEETTFNAE